MINRRSSTPQRMSGFTAIELMVVVSISAVLMALAAPNFNYLMERWRVRGAVEDLQSSLYFARSEAIRRGGDVTVTKKDNGGGCSNASNAQQWGCGWTISTGSGIVLQQTPPPTRVVIEITDDSSSGASVGGDIQVNRWGQFSNAGSNSLAFRLWPEGTGNTNTSAASLCLKPSGQLKRLSTGNASC